MKYKNKTEETFKFLSKKEKKMVKKKDIKSIPKVETPNSSGQSTPLNTSNVVTTDWYKIKVPFKNPAFKVSKHFLQPFNVRKFSILCLSVPSVNQSLLVVKRGNNGKV